MALLLRWVYTICFVLLLPFIYLRLYRKGRRLPSYTKRWGERLGFVNIPILDQSIWFHAVSVGEALAAVPLIRGFMQQNPHTNIVVTTMTPTGSDRICSAFTQDLNKNMYHAYIPYDIPWCLQRFIKKTNPQLFIAMETELWPNLFVTLQKKAVPILIANGRLSPKSCRSYKKFKWAIRPMIQAIHYIATQSTIDTKRFIEIGMHPHQVENLGNVKFDLQIKESDINQGSQLKQQFLGKFVWIAASTHAGEETLILQIFKQLKHNFPDLVLLLVPRHPDRFEEVHALCMKTGFVVCRRSKKEYSSHLDIYLGDTMGEMLAFYAASDMAFVGGSMVPVGGHNLLEPALLQLPIVTGPNLFNFAHIADLLLKAKGLKVVHDSQTLQEALLEFLRNSEMRQQAGKNAYSVIAHNQGAVHKIVEKIHKIWSTSKRTFTSIPLMTKQ
ncbi:MAG TPA: lipid IV(A) 3-deoxy-D-manno-octulosonic acid transferase [Gammaproteobacteria bacterium]|nr:lipid IV(A) 3-deoxy-D-manno-octulosonic acid transferase [Gammaproteobacteria bacterium]